MSKPSIDTKSSGPLYMPFGERLPNNLGEPDKEYYIKGHLITIVDTEHETIFQFDWRHVREILRMREAKV